MREWVGSVPWQQRDEMSFIHFECLKEIICLKKERQSRFGQKRRITFHYNVNLGRRAARQQNVFRRADANGAIHEWFGGGNGGRKRTMKINNAKLSGTYAATFINSLLMTYLAVVVLTCVYCVNVQTLRWAQMFGKTRVRINKQRAHPRSCARIQMLAQTGTSTVTSTHTQTHTLSLDILWESLGEVLLVDICPVSSLNRLLAPTRTRAKHFKHCCKYLTCWKGICSEFAVC